MFVSPRFSSHCEMLFLSSCKRCLRILALFVMVQFHLQVRIVFMELPLPQCSCQPVGLPGAGALSLGVDFSFFFLSVLQFFLFFRRESFPWPLCHSLGPSSILHILVLGGGVLGCFSFRRRSLGVTFFSLGWGGCQGFECFMGVGWVAVWLGSLPFPPLPSPSCA